MRDQEFSTAVKKLQPILFKKMLSLVKATNARDSLAIAEDLVAYTMLYALESSRKPNYLSYTCETLIWLKAKKAWSDYWNTEKKSFNHSRHLELDLEWPGEQSYDGSIAKEFLALVLSEAGDTSANIIKKRLEGYEVNEIAEILGKTPGAISMQIQRLKKRFLKGL